MNEEYKSFLQGAKKKFISEHFTLFDVCNSSTALKLGIDNRPTALIVTNATALAKNVLEKLFIKYGINSKNINSWYRCEALNIKIGGAVDPRTGKSTSQHVKAMAVDFTPVNHSIEEVFLWIKNNLIYDQVIFEGCWIHISFSLVNNRRQAMRLVNGKYITVK